MKKNKLSNSIWNYLDYQKGSNISKENFHKFLVYILRSEQTDSYVYCADGGEKIGLVPSADMIKHMNFTYDVEYNPTKSDFTMTLTVYRKKTWIFEFIITFRGSQGQFRGALSHETVKFSFNKDVNWAQ